MYLYIITEGLSKKKFTGCKQSFYCCASIIIFRCYNSNYVRLLADQLANETWHPKTLVATLLLPISAKLLLPVVINVQKKITNNL